MATEIKIRKLYDFGKQCHTDFLLTSCQKTKNCRDAEISLRKYHEFQNIECSSGTLAVKIHLLKYSVQQQF